MNATTNEVKGCTNHPNTTECDCYQCRTCKKWIDQHKENLYTDDPECHTYCEPCWHKRSEITREQAMIQVIGKVLCLDYETDNHGQLVFYSDVWEWEDGTLHTEEENSDANKV